MSETTVIGVFTAGKDAARAARAIRDARLGSVTTYAPTADHAVLSTRPPAQSPVRIFTLVGGLVGCAIGIALPIYTMVDWPLIVGGKPLVSIPPLVIISFELTMLGAALGGFGGFLLVSGLPQLRRDRWLGHQGARFTDDRFGVVVTCADAQQQDVCHQMDEAGAEQVEVEGAPRE